MGLIEKGKDYRCIGVSSSMFTNGKIYKGLAGSAFRDDRGDHHTWTNKKLFKERFEEVESATFLVSVDGQYAPKQEHNSLIDAVNESKRLASLPENLEKKVRLLKQIKVFKSKLEVEEI